jgi:TRAP-type uncharacterized transport system substrate-binding protein
MTSEQPTPPTVRFGASWSTQLRLMQAIGKGLSEETPIKAILVINEPGYAGLASGALDLVFLKSITNEHRSTGKGMHAAAEPDRSLRTIAWLPQEDRQLFAVAPWTGVTSFEEIASQKPALKMAGGAAEAVLEAYGFTYADIVSWGGSVRQMEHTAREAQARHAAGELDACFGDGSAYDFTAWRWMADRGYRFLDIREDVMLKLEGELGLRRNSTPSGFLPGIDHTLLALDDSHIVLTCTERLDDELAYLLAKVVDERKRDIECASIQVDYDHGELGPLPLTQPKYWTSVTSRISRQWDLSILGAPLHAGAERYYREKGVL